MPYSNKYKFLPNVDTHDIDIEHEFLHLVDTPTTFNGVGGYLVRVNTTESGVEFIASDDIPSSIIVEDDGDLIQNTPHTTLNFIGPGVTATDAGDGVVDITIPSRSVDDVFGLCFHEISSECESYTNSTEYVRKLRMSLSGIPGGEYRISWFYEWSQDNSNWRFEGRVIVDESEILSECKIRPSESSWCAWETDSGFGYQTLCSGSHTIDIDYKTSKWNKTAGIRRARLEFWRVS